MTDTKHTDSVEAEAHKQKLLVIAREWLLETDETNRNMVCMLIEDALAQYKLKLQATQSQQVEEAVRMFHEQYQEAIAKLLVEYHPGQTGKTDAQKLGAYEALERLVELTPKLSTPSHQD